VRQDQLSPYKPDPSIDRLLHQYYPCSDHNFADADLLGVTFHLRFVCIVQDCQCFRRLLALDHTLRAD